MPKPILCHIATADRILSCRRTKLNPQLGKTALGSGMRLAGATTRTRFRVVAADVNAYLSENELASCLAREPAWENKRVLSNWQ